MKNKKSPAFQFYPQDWLSSPRVAMMSLEEQGAYIRLLCYDWMNDGIPDNEESMLSLSLLKGSSTKVQQCFNKHPSKDGYLTNLRLLEERKKQDKWREKCSKGGRKSGVTRSKTARKTTTKGSSVLVASKDELKGNSSSSSSSSNKKVIKKYSVEVEEIYKAYPKRVGKANALKAIESALDLIHPDKLLKIVKVYAKSRENQDMQYTKHPATWFNQQCWEDDQSTWFKGGAKPVEDEWAGVSRGLKIEGDTAMCDM